MSSSTAPLSKLTSSVAPFAEGGELETRIVAQITWGRILTGSVLP